MHPFPPLDPDERLPREEKPGERLGLQFYRTEGGWRRLNRPELAAVVGFPAVIVLAIVVWGTRVPLPVAVALFAVVIGALAAFALSGRGRMPK